jgi:hypothetical protein
MWRLFFFDCAGDGGCDVHVAAAGNGEWWGLVGAELDWRLVRDFDFFLADSESVRVADLFFGEDDVIGVGHG